MGKPIIILADTEEAYISSLEARFIEELFHKMDLEIITDAEYFQETFNHPRNAKILIVSEALYHPLLKNHSVEHIFVLTEQPQAEEAYEQNVHRIFKYKSVKEIFNEVMYVSSNDFLGERNVEKETQVILVYSPVGGVGKTVTALGLSASLSAGFKKVLYLDAEHIQSFQYFFTSGDVVSNDIYRELARMDTGIYERIRPFIKNEVFDYLPPFRAALSSLNLRFSCFQELVKGIKATREYDFIILDTDSVFDDDKAELIKLADKVLLLITQDRCSTAKMTGLLCNLNCSDSEKYLFICNKYQKDVENELLTEERKNRMIISEYLEQIPNCEQLMVQTMKEITGFQKLAYLFI